jgi:tetratricopeptide (TPR) repeat protein
MKKSFLIIIFLFSFTKIFTQIEKRFFKEGYFMYLEDNYEKALQYFDATIELNPKFDSAYYYRGLVKTYLMRENWYYADSAIKDFSIAIDINPKFAECYYQRARLKDANFALEDFSKSIHLKSNRRYFLLRGKTYEKLRDYANAKKDYFNAIEISPNYAESYLELASLLLNHTIPISKNEINDSSLKYISRHIVCKYDTIPIDFLKSSEKDIVLKYISECSKLIVQHSNNFNLYLNRGIANLVVLDLSSSINDFSNVIKLNPLSSEAYFYRGIIKHYLKSYDEAVIDLSEVVNLNPNDAIALNKRGVSKLILNDYNGALADFNQAIEIKPYDAVLYYNRGLVEKELGLNNEACLDWDKAAEHGEFKAYNLIKKYCK